MFEVHSINAKHNDLIHDVAFDFYGHRMATCSSDQHVKIWDQDKHGNWTLSSSWKAHSGSVWKVTWSHPEFGQVIATCSFDRTACVWEEVGGGEKGAKRWVKRANLVDSRTSVTDVKFAPKFLGLYLTTCAADGSIRIYEAPDVMNLSQWTQQHEVNIKLPCSCLTWTNSHNRQHLPLIAAASDDGSLTAGPKVSLYEYSDQVRKLSKIEALASIIDPVHDITFASTNGRTYHLLAVATKNVRIIKIRPYVEKPLPGGASQTVINKYDVTTVAVFEDHYCTVWRVCWNVLGTILASSGDDGCVRLWKSYRDCWKCVNVLKGDGIIPPAEVPTAVAVGTVLPTSAQQSGASLLQPAKARYLKLGTISHPSQNKRDSTSISTEPKDVVCESRLICHKT